MFERQSPVIPKNDTEKDLVVVKEDAGIIASHLTFEGDIPWRNLSSTGGIR